MNMLVGPHAHIYKRTCVHETGGWDIRLHGMFG